MKMKSTEYKIAMEES